jgi:cell division protein FtsW
MNTERSPRRRTPEPKVESDGFFRPRPLEPVARRARPPQPRPPQPRPPQRRSPELRPPGLRPPQGRSPELPSPPIRIDTRPPIAAQPIRSRTRPGRTGATRKSAPVQPASRGGYVLLVAVIAALNVIGLAMVLSASSVQSVNEYGSPWYYFERQILWLAFGTAAFAFSTRLDYHRWRKFSKLAMLISLIGLVAVLVPGIGVDVGSSSRWLGSGSLRIQPSEFAKLALVFFAADVLDRRATRIRNWTYSLTPVLVVLAVLAVLVMTQPDMGTTMVLACIALAALYCAAAPMGPLIGLIATGALVSLGLAIAAPYRFKRLLTFLHPLRDASNTGYQSAQGIEAIVSGRFFGVGLGASPASWGFLPNQQTDFIFAIVAQETGLLGSLLLVGLFGAFALLGVRAACRAPDRFGALVAGAITAWIVAQAIINIGAVVGLLPVTGVPLPFVSYGGSSLIFSMFAVGVLCSIAKRGVGPAADQVIAGASPELPAPANAPAPIRPRVSPARKAVRRIDRSEPIDRARKVYVDAGGALPQ